MEYVVIGVVVVLVLGVVFAAYLIPRRARTGPPAGPRPDLLGRRDDTVAPVDTAGSDVDSGCQRGLLGADVTRRVAPTTTQIDPVGSPGRQSGTCGAQVLRGAFARCAVVPSNSA